MRSLIYLLALVSATQAYELHMNCGGGAFVSPDGVSFVGDAAYTPGQAGFIGGRIVPHNHYPIGGTDMPMLYESWRCQFDEFVADVPPGDYVLTLHFAEIERHGPDLRVLSIHAEDMALLDSLDVFDVANHGYALRLRFPVATTDGHLNVQVLPLVGDNLLEGIEIVSWEPDSSAPAAPSVFVARGSYGVGLLTWHFPQEADFAGVLVYRTSALEPETCLTERPVPLPLFLDYGLAPGGTASYAVTSVDVFGNESNATPWEEVTALRLEDSPLPVYRIEVDPEALATLQADPQTDEYVDAVFWGEDTLYSPVGMRYRGNISRFMSKKSYKIRLDDGDTFQGVDRVNCNADFVDWSLIRSKLCYDLFDLTGIRPPWARHSHFHLNEEFAGVYLHLEQLDERFLVRTGRDPGASIYKCFGALDLLPSEDDYRRHYEKETNEDLGYDDLMEFIETINLTSADALGPALLQILDVASYLKYYAVIVATSNVDFTTHNYYLIHDLEDDMWEVVPWDMDHTFGISGAFDPDMEFDSPIDLGSSQSPQCIGGPNVLLDKILQIPAFRRFYCDELSRLLENEFSPEPMECQIDSLHGAIAHDARLDIMKLGREDNALFEGSDAELKEFVVQRCVFLLGEISAYAPEESLFVFINEVQARNDTTIADEYGEFDPWMELYNNSPGPVDISGWTLGSGGEEWTIPDTSISPGGFVLVWLDGEPSQGAMHSTWALGAEEAQVALRITSGAYQDSMTIPLAADDRSFGRYPDASSSLTFLPSPSPGASNGTPGGSAPEISGVERDPQWPRPYEPVLITARAIDPEGDDFLVDLFVDVGPGFAPIPMHDDGHHGDHAAHDGIFATTIPGQPGGTRVKYVVVATDAAGNMGMEPTFTQSFVYLVGWQPPPVVLNEFMASNTTTLADELGEYDDWIELHNMGPVPVPLTHMYLTDDLAEPMKWAFPDTTIEPGGFFLVWADDDEEQGPTHASFKLSADGEELGLFFRIPSDIVPLDTISFGPQNEDQSWGRYPDGTGPWGATQAPTPGGHNSGLGSENSGSPTLPMCLTLGDVTPNPTAGRCTVTLGLPQGGYGELVIYDLHGRACEHVWEGDLDAGWHQLPISPSLPSGSYLISAHGEIGTQYTRLVVLK